MVRVVMLACVLAAACSSGTAGRPAADAATVDYEPQNWSPPETAAEGQPEEEAKVPGPPYGEGVKSLRLKRSIAVRMEPDEKAKFLGTVAQDTRVLFENEAISGPGCDAWIQIDPRGWVCQKYLEPNKRGPIGVEMPKVKPGELLPGTYGKITGDKAVAYRSMSEVVAGDPGTPLEGSIMVRKASEAVSPDGKVFWKTTEGELIAADQITEFEGSPFEGVWLDQTNTVLPVAWVRSRSKSTASVAVRGGPSSRARKLHKLEPLTMVSVLEESEDGKFARIGIDEWVALADLHVARHTDPPPLMLPDERWIDIDLDEQVLVAYEGYTPVFATVVSTGKKKTPTAEGVYRIWVKFAETDMNGQMADEPSYRVSTVPWTMFFAKDLALHTAYWHDRFGEPRSHGCVNLAPRDARTLYFWTSPDVPPGWSMSHGVRERPGSVVRVRSAAVPSPEPKGYAKAVYEARGGTTPIAPEQPEPVLPEDRGLEEIGKQ